MEKSKSLINAGLDYIVFSVDGYNKTTYEEIRVGANFEEVEKNILDFLKVNRENNFRTKTQIQFIKLPKNIKEQSKYIDKWMKTDIDCINIKDFSTRAGMLEHMDNFTDLNVLKNKLKKRKPCYYLWGTLIVLWDGKVIVCCQDLLGDLVVGDVNNQKLIDIWNSDKLKKLREEQLNGSFSGPCKNCADWKKGPSNYMSYGCSLAWNMFNVRIMKRMQKDEGISIIINKRK